MKLLQSQYELISSYFATKPVESVFLFGSYARGDADVESDIDLMVSVAVGVKRPLDVVACGSDLQKLLTVRVEVYLEHQLPKYVKNSIQDEAMLIYPVPAEL